MISRKKYWLSALLIIVVAASSFVQLTKNKNWTIEKYYSQKLNWSDCYSGFECATFLVPVDYEKIDNKNFKLKILRHRASENKNRIGTLVVNPGGPGGSATDYAFNAESRV